LPQRSAYRGRATENRSPARDFRAVPEPGCADLTGLNILVVEDSVDLGIAVASLLRSCGAEVAGPVATAADADRLIAAGRPDAAVVDLHLRAGERADELIVRLNDRGVRVIVTSGDSGRLETRAKAAVTLSKPFSEDELIAALMPAQIALMASRTAQASAPPLPAGATR
jgi:DNA-binding response OmpR family regulator